MEKTVNTAIDKLMASTKDWDMAILFIRGKSPMAVERDVNLKWEKKGVSIVMTAETGHPSPQSQADVHKKFDMYSYLEVSEIFAVDFYTEKRIQTSTSGPVISMR